MESKSFNFKNPVDIPVEPQVYALLSQAFCDNKLKECMLLAVNKYNKTCEKAYAQLIEDLKSCLDRKKP